tara:strand:- start:1314 stop:1844 length:531 start_codon:yes stop_codon:yes gene_type:complete
MKKFLIVLILFFVQNCSKPKIAYICGDHICVNKTEAEQYFEENLILEVKILKIKKKKDIDLVEINLIKNAQSNNEVKIFKKENTNKKVKILTKDEVKEIKANIKNKEKKLKKNAILNKEKKIKKNKAGIVKKNVNKNIQSIPDVCSLLENCTIDEISKYLLKQGKKKDFPDITLKE